AVTDHAALQWRDDHRLCRPLQALPCRRSARWRAQRLHPADRRAGRLFRLRRGRGGWGGLHLRDLPRPAEGLCEGDGGAGGGLHLHPPGARRGQAARGGFPQFLVLHAQQDGWLHHPRQQLLDPCLARLPCGGADLDPRGRWGRHAEQPLRPDRQRQPGRLEILQRLPGFRPGRLRRRPIAGTLCRHPRRHGGADHRRAGRRGWQPQL
ncbi:MAG: hypothetical protein AVDCRST_MAG27-327, partial [uncultured Craurococcus sp.]